MSGSNDEDETEKARPSRIEALLRGLGQGASLGWGDELVPMLMSDIDDGTGIPREYAAGSSDADARNTIRRENQEAQEDYPGAYFTGQLLGGAPSAIAMGGLGRGATTAARVAASGLAGGARGGIEGAGLADEGNRLKGAAYGAAPAAGLSMAGAAAPAAINAVKNLFKGGPPNMSGMAPAYATVGADMAPAAASAEASKAGGAGGALINQMTKTAPRMRGRANAPKDVESPKSDAVPAREAMPPQEGAELVDEIPRAGRMPKMSWEQADDIAQRADVLHADKVLEELEPRTAPRMTIIPESSEGPLNISAPKAPKLPIEYRNEYMVDWGPEAPQDWAPNRQMADDLSKEMWRQQDNLRRAAMADRGQGQAWFDRQVAGGATRGSSLPPGSPSIEWEPLPGFGGMGEAPKPAAPPSDFGEFSLSSPASEYGEFKLPSKGMTIEQTSQAPNGVEHASVSVKPGVKTPAVDMKKLMSGIEDLDD